DSRSEGSLQDLEAVAQEGRHIESDLRRSGAELVAVLGEPSSRQPADPGLLDRIDSFSRYAEPGAGASLDLAEHDGPALADHQVQLAFAASPVTVQDVVAVGSIPGFGPVLPDGAQGPPAPSRRRVGNAYSSFSG